MSAACPPRLARAALTYLAEPGDPALGALLERCGPDEILAAVKAGVLPPAGRAAGHASPATLAKALSRWRLRLGELPGAEVLAALAGGGPGDPVRLVCPGEADWPGALDELGPARPYALWLRGAADLADSCEQSVSMVGSRAATGYGAHVAGELAGDLAEQGWTVVSGGAYGIDAAVHRGALLTGGTTIVVLACGTDHPYPAGHAELFAQAGDRGLVVSEWPPGSRPTRLRFLIRNRVIAALTRGTVVVEAGERSGALNTARHAAELGRPLMAVPGPVTSPSSAGCHRIIRDWNGTLVTGTQDVLAALGWQEAAALPGPRHEPETWDDLDLDSARVLDAFPTRAAIGPSTIARTAGVDLPTVQRCVGVLAGCGFIEPADKGWRLTRKPR